MPKLLHQKNAGTLPITCALCRINLPMKKRQRYDKERPGEKLALRVCLALARSFWGDCIFVADFGCRPGKGLASFLDQLIVLLGRRAIRFGPCSHLSSYRSALGQPSDVTGHRLGIFLADIFCAFRRAVHRFPLPSELFSGVSGSALVV